MSPQTSSIRLSPCRTRRTLRTVLFLGAALTAAELAAHSSPPGVDAAEGSAFAYYPAQLHLHGSLSEGDGSMRGHNAVALDLGTVDVIWWTDHDWRIAGHAHIPGCDFENSEGQVFRIPYRDTPWTRHDSYAGVSWRDETDDRIRSFEARLTGDAVALGDRALEIVARSERRIGAWQWAGIVLRDSDERLSAPLASGVEVELRVHPLTAPGRDRRLVIRLGLSRQVEGFSELAYAVGDPGEPRLEVEGGRRRGIVPVQAPVGRWSRLVLRVTEDVLRFDLGGLDNSLREVSIGMEVRRGARAAMVVDALRVRRSRSGAEVLSWAETTALRLGTEYGITNHVGLEVSYADHMNAYLPVAELPDFDLHPHGMTAAQVVPWVHERGGVVSYNHVFGAIRSDDGQYEQRARRVVENRAFGADLLEVGYPHRVLPLERHLEVWDDLSRDRVFIGGIGTSDSHSQSRGWSGGNNFVTWVWARSSDRLDLIRGLRKRNAFFGDPVRFHGQVFLKTRSGGLMGSVVRSDENEHEVVLRITDLPRNSTVRWIEQGEVAEAFRPRAGEFTHTFRVDTRQYRFVRAEVWQGGRGIAFSNCLYFVPSQLRTGAPSSPGPP